MHIMQQITQSTMPPPGSIYIYTYIYMSLSIKVMIIYIYMCVSPSIKVMITIEGLRLGIDPGTSSPQGQHA